MRSRREAHQARSITSSTVPLAIFVAQARQPLDADAVAPTCARQIAQQDVGDAAVVGDDRLDFASSIPASVWNRTGGSSSPS